MRLAIPLILSAYCASAQPLPDAQTLFEHAQAAAKNFHSLQYSAEMTVEAGLPTAPMKSTTEVAYLNPGKTRMDIKIGNVSILDVCDGETIWIYKSMAKEYTSIPAAQGPAAVVALMGSNLPELSSIHVTYKTAGEETIDIDGQKHECWVVEMHIGEFSVPSPQADKPQPKVSGAVMTSWIDKKLGIDVQFNFVMKMQMGAQDMEMHQKVVKKNIKIDQPVDEALFTFTPPPGAKEVKGLKLFGAVTSKPDLAGKPAPAFEVKSLGGETFSLAALKGKTVLLDFWATWCGPCRKSMPVLEKISSEFKNSDLVILGVNTGEDREVVEEFLKKTPLQYPAVLSGESGILESYGVTAYPTFILIGRDGNVIANEVGFGGEDQLRQMIDKAGLVAKKP
jgi:thiol-disulfide isomerase/thioredoxin/outer membrane lipoprotein-sorting protein